MVATDTSSATGRRRNFGGVANADGSATGAAARLVVDEWVITDMGNSLSWGVLHGNGGTRPGQPVVMTCNSPTVIVVAWFKVTGIVPDWPIPDQATDHCASARTV